MRAPGRGGFVGTAAFLLASIAWLGGAPAGVSPASAAVTPTLPAGFTDETIVTGLDLPTVMAIAPTGRVFVGQKGGVIKTWSTYAAFASNGVPTQTIDLSSDVYNYWDRGLMGLAVDPAYPASPYIYVLYTYDAPPGKTAPYWHDACNSPANGGPGATTDGCPAQNRLDRVTINTSTGVATARSALLTGWCQQFPSHTAGNLAFGADGDLYVSAGEGASFGPADWGQFGGTEPTIANPITPANPCGDPVNPAYLPGGAQYGLGYDANAEGGALRAQSFRRTNGPTLLNAALLRIDKATGAGAAGNPAAASTDANARRIVAYGFRNPFRFTIRPGSNDVYVGNVGNISWEAIDRVADPTAAGGPPNFGWPCREGPVSNGYYGSTSLAQCTSLALSAITPPIYEYAHSGHVVANDTCPTGGAAVSGLAFYEGTSYPPAYRQGLFFVDYTRSCISLLQAGTDGLPDKTKPLAFGRIPNPTQIITDPSGDLLYVDFDQTSATSGSIHRIRYQSPKAHLAATPMAGSAPLDVAFDSAGSTAPAGIATYDWDFGDGSQHGTGSTASHQYAAGGFTATLTITDTNGATSTASQAIQSGTQPTVTIDSPTTLLRWKVGDTIALKAHASDAYDATLPDSAYSWNIVIEHCPSDCHEHHLETLVGPNTSVDAPDHDYPSWLKVTLTVTDSIGLAKTVTLDHVDPATTSVTVQSSPSGLPVSVDGFGGTTTIGPQTMIVGHQFTIAASATYQSAESVATFTGWSDGGSLSHVATAPATAAATFTASYSRTVHDRSNTCSGAPVESAIWTYWQGQFLAAGDVDWLRFKVGAGTYRIVLGNLPQDASLELWNGCSSLRLHSDLSGTHWEEIVTTLPAGTYALRVTDKGGSSSGTYAVRVTTLSSPVGITSARGIASSTQVRLVGEVINLSSGYRSVTVTARLYGSSGKLLATYAIHPHVNPMPHARETFLLAVPKPTGYAKVTFSVTSTASSARPRLLPVSGVTSAAGPPGTWLVSGTVSNTSTTTASGVRAITAIFDRYGFIINATYAVVGTGTLAPNASATFHASFTVTGAVGGYRVVGQRF